MNTQKEKREALLKVNNLFKEGHLGNVIGTL